MLKLETRGVPNAEREGLDRSEFLKEPKGMVSAAKNCGRRVG